MRLYLEMSSKDHQKRANRLLPSLEGEREKKAAGDTHKVRPIGHELEHYGSSPTI
jgi:hypothetical protein